MLCWLTYCLLCLLPLLLAASAADCLCCGLPLLAGCRCCSQCCCTPTAPGQALAEKMRDEAEADVARQRAANQSMLERLLAEQREQLEKETNKLKAKYADQ